MVGFAGLSVLVHPYTLEINWLAKPFAAWTWLASRFGGSTVSKLCISPSHFLGLTVQGSLSTPLCVAFAGRKYALCNCKPDTSLWCMKSVTPTNKIITVLLVQGSGMQKHPLSCSSHSQTCLCYHHVYEVSAGRIHRISIHRISWSLGALGTVVERLGFLGSHRKNSLGDPNHSKSQIRPCWNSEFGPNVPQKLHTRVLLLPSPVNVGFSLFVFSSMLWSVVLLRSRKDKESNCVTPFGTPEKSQAPQEPQSETDFAQLGLLCIMAAPWAVGMFLCSRKVSVSLSGKMKFFGGKLFLSGRTTHSNRKWSTR